MDMHAFFLWCKCFFYRSWCICKGFHFSRRFRSRIQGRIPVVEAQRRRLIYHESCTAFMFRWRGKTWCIDAARDDGSLGRLVNDEHRRPNCKMKNIDVNGSPHLCLFALMDIKQGEEISYDYGGEDCPWRTETTTVGPNALLVEDLHTVVLANTEVGDATHPNIAQQMTTVGDDALLDGGSKPVLSNTEGDDDATRPKITKQKRFLKVKTKAHRGHTVHLLLMKRLFLTSRALKFHQPRSEDNGRWLKCRKKSAL
ncbi:uncharacterized protein LOC130378166 isoform X3 [Gadus chalcogrammus]|uniref:uncharacterized protein LOC130378166 isoform X3 n=1 Tax=Gadus chalcogrammus TaxID=1042646 RepID=UPI0024C3BC9F|nr:uncharacterized protein LOC130378166 isoform X3 [Gadus chalcogrammus]